MPQRERNLSHTPPNAMVGGDKGQSRVAAHGLVRDPDTMRHSYKEAYRLKINEIVAQLREERDRLDRAIAALSEASGKMGRVARGQGGGRKRRRRGGRMSSAARKRLSAMMKKRWAERKRQGKSRL